MQSTSCAHSAKAQDHAPHTQARQRWMRAFALGQEATLEAALQSCDPAPIYTFLRKPEAGMIMLEGKAGNSGQRFNLGEMLVTRCAVSVKEHSKNQMNEGHAYIMGNNPKHAIMAALLDALMQDSAYTSTLEKTLVAPLLATHEAQRNSVTAETARTKVDFFTMVRGEDA